MYTIRRKAVESASRVSSRTSRRYASGHGHEHHEAPKPESLGTQFNVALAAIPFTIGLYTLSQKSSDGKVPGLTAALEKYSDYKERWAARNALHTSMIEQAAFDRNLFHSSKGSKHVELKFPEIFNTGSPHNVVAGQRARNMDELVAHYENLNAETEAKKGEASKKE